MRRPQKMKSFTPTKGEAPCAYEILIALSKNSEKTYRSLMFSISALFIARSDRQFEWFRCCTESALKFSAIVNYFKTDWFSWIGIVSVVKTIVFHSWAEDNYTSLARDVPFSKTSPTRSFQSERDSGSTQAIFKLKQKACVGFFKTA